MSRTKAEDSETLVENSEELFETAEETIKKTEMESKMAEPVAEIVIKPTALAVTVSATKKMNVSKYLQYVEIEQVWSDMLKSLYPRTVMTKAEWDETLYNLMNKKIIS